IFLMMVLSLFIIGHMGLFFYNKIGSRLGTIREFSSLEIFQYTSLLGAYNDIHIFCKDVV
ncbi:hypothetical protein C2L82_10315, partial [Streptococcus pneumoniae]|nr:hypothetical protein [Streptococcus pneumoniae]